MDKIRKSVSKIKEEADNIEQELDNVSPKKAKTFGDPVVQLDSY
jgi:hypothetical protein